MNPGDRVSGSFDAATVVRVDGDRALIEWDEVDADGHYRGPGRYVWRFLWTLRPIDEPPLDELITDPPSPAPRPTRPAPPATSARHDRPPRLGVTVVDEDHGSFLTCHRRLGCTDRKHARARADYQRELRHRNGSQRPAKRGRTHGTRSTYRICTAGPNGGKCEPCLEAERSYVADWRRRTGRITGAKRGPKPRAR